jgi:hypothetical protein
LAQVTTDDVHFVHDLPGAGGCLTYHGGRSAACDAQSDIVDLARDPARCIENVGEYVVRRVVDIGCYKGSHVLWTERSDVDDLRGLRCRRARTGEHDREARTVGGIGRHGCWLRASGVNDCEGWNVRRRGRPHDVRDVLDLNALVSKLGGELRYQGRYTGASNTAQDDGGWRFGVAHPLPGHAESCELGRSSDEWCGSGNERAR